MKAPLISFRARNLAFIKQIRSDKKTARHLHYHIEMFIKSFWVIICFVVFFLQNLRCTLKETIMIIICKLFFMHCNPSSSLFYSRTEI